MKINVFGKEIEFDENNPGIKYFLEESCEFPDENWIATEYARINNVILPEDCHDIMEKICKEDIIKLIVHGIIDTLSLIEDGYDIDLSREKNYVRMAF